jgi:hypothetical protein
MHAPTPHSAPAFRSRQVDGVVRQIVERSLPLAQQRVSAETTAMSADELRGYLRARASIAVRDQTLQLPVAYQFDSGRIEQLFERALERTVNVLLRELTQQPPLIIPVYQAPLRSAA